jgi:predicted amidohydrolase
VFDTPCTLAKLIHLTRGAASQKADIVVFPEAFIGKSPKGWFRPMIKQNPSRILNQLATRVITVPIRID